MRRNIVSVGFSWLLAALAAAGMLLAAGPAAGAVAGGAVTGTVRDGGGQIVVGAAVNAFEYALGLRRTTTTAADGIYRFARLPVGSWSICLDSAVSAALPAGYVGSCGSTIVAAGRDLDGPTLSAVPAAGVGGRVTDAAGRPVADVGVSTSTFSTGGFSLPYQYTDADGRFQILGLDPRGGKAYACFAGRYADRFSTHEAHGDGSSTGFLSECWRDIDNAPGRNNLPSTPIPVTAGQISVISPQLGPAAAISGTVRAASGPVGGITVSFRGLDPATTGLRTTLSDDAGRYRFNALAAGRYEICFVPTVGAPYPPPSGYVVSCFDRSYDAPTPVVATVGAVTTGVDGLLDAGGAVVGVVRDLQGAPVAGVRVTVDDRAVTTSGADGSYRIPLLTASRHQVCFDGRSGTGGVSAAGYASGCWRANGTLGAGAADPITVVAGRDSRADVAVGAASGFRVLVTDLTGAPLTGATIQYWYGDQRSGSSGNTGYSAEDGTFVVTGLPAASYTVCVTEAGYATGGSSAFGYANRCYGATDSSPSSPFTTRRGQLAPVPIVLSPVGAVAGRVTDAAGRPLAGISLTAVSGGVTRYATTRDDGRYTVPGMPAGSWQVRFYAGQRRVQSRCYLDAEPNTPGTPVIVTNGRLTRGIDQVLPRRA